MKHGHVVIVRVYLSLQVERVELLHALKSHNGSWAVNGSGDPSGSQDLNHDLGMPKTTAVAKRDFDKMNAIHVNDGQMAIAWPRVRTLMTVVAELDDETTLTERVRVEGASREIPALKKIQLLQRKT